MEQHADIHVVGGGLAGLVAAKVAVEAGRTVVLHDASGRLGGRARTDDHQGFAFNQGPHALYLDGPGVAILERLGLRPLGRSPAVRGTRMVRGSVSHLAPVGAVSLLRTGLLGPRAKADLGRILTGIGRLDAATVAASSVEEWVARCTDDETAADVLRSLVRLTTYVNAPEDLSADVAVTQLQLALGSGVIYLDGGWQNLVDQLVDPRVELRLGRRASEVPDAPAVILATGGPEAATALTGHRFEETLDAGVSVLDIGLAAPPRHRVVLGTDCPLYLSDHGFPAGMTPPGRWSVSVAQYLGRGDVPDRDALRAFTAHAGIDPDEIVAERYLHRMTSVTAIATAQTGGLGGRPDHRVPHAPGLFVAGDWVGPRGHLLDAVVCSAHEAALAALHHLDSRPVAR